MTASVPSRARPGLRRYWILLGCLVCQMGLGFSYVFTTFLKPITEDFGWGRSLFAASPLLLAMALSAPVVGTLTDRFGARRVLSLSTLLLAAMLLAFASMQSLWHFYGASLLFGVALTGLGDIPVGAVASRWFDRGRGLALGVIYTGSNAGGAIVPVAATAMAVEASWRFALVGLAAAALVVILPFAFFVVRNPTADETVGDGEEAAPTPEPSLDLRAARRTRTFWILFAVLLAFYFVYLGVMLHLVAFLSDSGFSDPGAALRFSGFVAAGIVGKLAIGLLADRIPKKAALLVNFGLLAAALGMLLALESAPSLLYPFLFLFGFTVAAENVLLPLIVAECFGVMHMAQVYGALMVALLPGGWAGPVFSGWVFDTQGTYAPAFVTFAALAFASFAALFLVRREVGRAESPASALAG